MKPNWAIQTQPELVKDARVSFARGSKLDTVEMYPPPLVGAVPRHLRGLEFDSNAISHPVCASARPFGPLFLFIQSWHDSIESAVRVQHLIDSKSNFFPNEGRVNMGCGQTMGLLCTSMTTRRHSGFAAPSPQGRL